MSDTNPTSKERVTQIMDTIRRVAREQKSYRENTIRDLEDGANLLARLSVETTEQHEMERLKNIEAAAREFVTVRDIDDTRGHISMRPAYALSKLREAVAGSPVEPSGVTGAPPREP